ncbi:O-antigen polymerase [Maribacter sp. MAR_2009_72]|uniref:O-antigen polymerase n=1 Tax=Maribacter sp. MAR_2009_72 TaxID=1250050 RepID=UPI00119BD3DB|nr:O-antigen polymerase [Maribacter sp. MAR_2009_72]TVZ16178.1 oligosaccharide repeat unit polymerase [Maribacter sp. MAR_2009_72]
MYRLLRNPLYIYLLGFSLSFLVYFLDWSELYPEISTSMIVFFSITFFCFGAFGFVISHLKLIQKTYSNTKSKQIVVFATALLFFYLIEFIIEGDIPLISKLLGRDGVHYMEFGVPLLHGILISFNSFLIAHTFSTYLSTKNKQLLKVYFVLYIPALLFFSRSILMLGLLTSVFIYIHYSKKLKLKNQIKLVALGVIALYLFGVLGNLRSGGDYIYDQSKATQEFMESSIPKEFYWTYLYVASPLANFQNTVNHKQNVEKDFVGFIFYENLPQIISKNLGGPLNIPQKDLVRLIPWLTVGTTYAKSISYLGWLGPYLLFLFNLLVYLAILMFMVPTRSNYHITTLSILSVIILLNIFANMLVVTGISFQLAYCVIFAFFERKKIVLRT